MLGKQKAPEFKGLFIDVVFTSLSRCCSGKQDLVAVPG